MIITRLASERRHVQRGRSHLWPTFTLQDTSDLLAADFGTLAVINEVWIAPGEGTAPFSGDETETVTYVYQGTLARVGAGEPHTVRAGEFLRQATGRGVRNNETNASAGDWARIYRISLRQPDDNVTRGCEQERFTNAQRRNLLCLVASPDGRDGSLRIHQDTFIYSSLLDPGRHLAFELPRGRSVWFHLVCGVATLNGVTLAPGDGVGIADEASFSLTVQEASEILLLDLGLPLTPSAA